MNDFAKVDNLVPLLILFLLGESLYNYKKGKMIRLNDAISSLSAGMMSRTILKFVYDNVEVSLYGYSLKLSKINPLFMSDGFMSGVLLVLLVDLSYYVAHRYSHINYFLWMCHSPHHSSEEYNYSTAFRQGILENLVFWVFYIPLIPFFKFEQIMFYKQINITYQFFVHTETIGKLHPLIEYIFNTPSHHRVHHARNDIYLDKNFSGMFVLYDRFFSTFQEEHETPVYGLVHPTQSFNPIWIQVEQMHGFANSAKNMPNLSTKVQALFFSSPGVYYDFKTNRLETPKVPSPYLRMPKYDPKTSPSLTMTSLIQFLIMIRIFYWFNDSPIVSEFSGFCIFVVFIVFQLIYISYLLEIRFTAFLFFAFQFSSLVFLSLALQIDNFEKLVLFLSTFFAYPLFTKFIDVEKLCSKIKI